MQISQKRLEEFKRLYEEEFGVELSNNEAYEKAFSLLSVAKMFITPLRKKKDELK